MCFLLARQQIYLESVEEDENLYEVITNSRLSEDFLYLASDLDVLEVFLLLCAHSAILSS
jgi:hypothetical protein